MWKLSRKGEAPSGTTKKKMNNPNMLSMGIFSLISSMLVLLILILLNLTVEKIPSQYTELDVSDAGVFSLDSRTEEIVGNIEKQTNIYWIVQSGNENSEIEILLNRYSDLSALINVEKIDPVVNPGFTERYTDLSVNENSIIVANEDRYRYISYDNIFVHNYNYMSGADAETEFDGENQITGAIDYVNSGYMPKIYRITGHNEVNPGSTFEEAVSNENYSIEKLSLIGLESIPEDADCLLIAGPKNDLTEAEGELVKSYLDDGGRLLVYTDYEHTDMPVLMKILTEYGIEVEDGLVLEGDQYMCYGNYPMQLLPAIGYHDITSPLIRGGYSILVPMAHGLILPETTESGITVTDLLTTSSSAYAKEGTISTISIEETDAKGPFSLGVAIEDKRGDETAKIVWYTSSDLLNSEYDSLVNGSNTDLMLNSAGFLTDKESSITIHAKKVSGDKLTISSADKSRIGIILIGIMPLAYLCIGIVISVRRRKR